jgi:hypothetical protein
MAKLGRLNALPPEAELLSMEGCSVLAHILGWQANQSEQAGEETDARAGEEQGRLILLEGSQAYEC